MSGNKQPKAQLPNNTITKDLEAIFPKPPEMIAWEKTEGHDRFPDVYQIKRLDAIRTLIQHQNIFLFVAQNGHSLKIQYLNEHIVRVTYALEGDFEPDFSYAIDPKFTKTDIDTKVKEDEKGYSISSKILELYIDKSNGALTIKDKEGVILSEDANGFSQMDTILEGTEAVRLQKQSPKGEIFYGLGDKSCSLNLRGKRFENWNTDAFGYGTNSDPLYRAIPFYYGLREGKGYGIFFDNTHRTWFDFDRNRDEKMEMWAEGGEVNYYFIAGPSLLDVAMRYTDLTGKPEMIPMWGLGFHQCRWSYFPDTRVKEVAQEFRKRAIPCDAIYLDIDYMEGYRCFTVNETHFPDLKQLSKDLAEDGFHMVVMIDPGIRADKDYHVYKEGIENDYFCKRKDGKVMRGPVWPQDCAWPDYTKEEVRNWFGELYRKLYEEQNISGFWNDMNEPAVFKVDAKTFPEDVRHYYEGMDAQHSRIHNVYGLLMARSTQEGLLKIKPNKRPVVVTRASYSGGQRYSAAWTGDNVASWEHLAIANRQCQRMSISGFSFIGTDIGGFVDQPTGELLVRWLQLGVFHPFYRIHSMGNNEDGAAEVDADKIAEFERTNRMDQEPWVFGDKSTDLAKEAIELRYELLPYLYSVFHQHTQTGAPVLRQLAFVDQSDPNTLLREDEFMYGDHLLAVNIHKPGQTKKKIYLPVGNWIDYWSEEVYEGKKEHQVAVSVHHLPIFIKGGSFIPHYPVRQHTGEGISKYTLRYYAEIGTFNQDIFEDAGEGFEFKDGSYFLRNLKSTVTSNSILIEQHIQGSFELPYKETCISLRNIPFNVGKVEVDGKAILFEKDEHRGNVRIDFNVENRFSKVNIYE